MRKEQRFLLGELGSGRNVDFSVGNIFLAVYGGQHDLLEHVASDSRSSMIISIEKVGFSFVSPLTNAAKEENDFWCSKNPPLVVTTTVFPPISIEFC